MKRGGIVATLLLPEQYRLTMTPHTATDDHWFMHNKRGLQEGGEVGWATKKMEKNGVTGYTWLSVAYMAGAPLLRLTQMIWAD